jgi:glycosyltransferase involved in cell wall biosynthesis
VIAGAEVDPAYGAKVRSLAARIGVLERIVFTGRLSQERLPGLYRGAVCAFFLSTAETFGITQVEAMACGTPLIASDIPVTREIAGDAAAIVPPTDLEAIVGALTEVLDDPKRRAEMSRRGLERAKRFTWDETARGLHQVVLERLRLLEGR